jgi:hypothetical protein
MQKRPKTPHPFLSQNTMYFETSDDLRICDFTCQPDLIIAEKKPTHPLMEITK